MSIIAWIVLGLIAGFIAAKIVNKKGAGFFLNIVLGIVGAVVGGEIFTALGESRVTGVNLYSLIVSVIGAIVVLIIYHAIARPAGAVSYRRAQWRRLAAAPLLGVGVFAKARQSRHPDRTG